MSKVHTLAKNSKKSLTQSNKAHSLDTLAQLSTNNCNKLKGNDISEQKRTLQKRAKSKAFTQSYLFDLIDLKSNLNKSYWQTYHCSNVVLQEGEKISSRYCNQRWCLTCNRIRTAKMINGYTSELSQLDNAQFVTLTFPNVKAKDLKLTIKEMSSNLKDIRKNLKKTYGYTLKGLRKYECTYNASRNDYNPHYHLIIEGKEQSEQLINLWLKKYPKAERKAQDYTPVNDETINELCKYFTKVISKDNDYNPKALDIMFRAVKGLRTFQPIGIKKVVSEDIEEIQAQTIDWIAPQNEVFVYEKEVFDWVSGQGEILSDYKPTKEDYKVINQEYKNNRETTEKQSKKYYLSTT